MGANILQSGNLATSPRHSNIRSGDFTSTRNDAAIAAADRLQAQTIRVDSSMKREPLAGHKRNLTVGFNQLNSGTAFNTLQGPQTHAHEDSIFFDDEVNNLKARPSMKLSDIFNSQMLNSEKDGAIGSQNSLFQDGNNTFTSNLSKRLAQAMLQHTSAQGKWFK